MSDIMPSTICILIFLIRSVIVSLSALFTVSFYDFYSSIADFIHNIQAFVHAAGRVFKMERIDSVHSIIVRYRDTSEKIRVAVHCTRGYDKNVKLR